MIPAIKAYVSLEGAGADKTIIEWNDTADLVGQTGRPLGTFGSATFAVNSPYFIAKNITFQVSQSSILSFTIGFIIYIYIYNQYGFQLSLSMTE